MREYGKFIEWRLIMKTLVIYYSFSGKTRAISQELAAKESYDIAEIKDVKRFGVIKAFTAGILATAKGKPWPIQPLAVEWSDYDRLILLSPIWAGNQPPAVNAFLEILPEGKAMAVKMVSGSGKSACRERMEAAIKRRGSNLESFEDVQAPGK
jgi:flavodoxin